MPERSSVAQVAQVGVEVTPGTAVAATKRLGSMSYTPSTQAEVSTFRPTGLKFASVAALNREWAEVAMEGQPTFEEIIIPLSNVVGTAVVSSVLDGATPTGAYEWLFTPASAAADAPKTLTLEFGQSGVQAEKYAHVLGTAFNLNVSRSEATIGGSGFAQAAQTGITPTPALAIPTDLTPLMPGGFSFYQAATQGGLAAGRLLRAISCEASIEDRFNPAWFVNALVQSFATWTENPDGNGGGVNLVLEADAAGMAFYTQMRAGSTGFFRLECEGPVVYNAGAKPNLKMLFQWDLAYKITNIEAMSDEDGIYAIPLTLTPVHDSTWGKAMTFLVRNKVATL